jgi:O-antigen/teichoic acid export membrane protein
MQPVTGTLLARNATRNLVALGVPLAVALAALPVIVNRLDTARFGVLGLVWVCFGLFSELGMGRATTKYAAAEFAAGRVDRVRAVLRVGVLLQLALGLLLGAGLAVAAPAAAARIAEGGAVAYEARLVFLLIAASLPFITVAAACRGILEAAHRFDLVNRVRVPLSASTYLLPAVLVVVGSGLIGITACLAVTRLAGTAAYAWLALKLLDPVDADEMTAGATAPDMLAFAAWQTAGGLLTPVLVYLDRILLAAVAGVAAVGLYTPAFEVATRMLILPAAVVMALFPAFSAWSRAEPARAARAAARSVLFIAAALAPPVVLVLGLGADALRLWLSAEFARETAVALGILSCGALLNAAAHVPVTLLQGAGRPDIPTKLYLLELLPYLLMAVLLIERWGVTGAAAAWSIRVAVDSLLLFAATHGVGALPFGELVRSRVPQAMLGITVVGVAPALAAGRLAEPWLRAGATTLALVATCAFLGTYALRADGRARLAAALGLVST